MVTADAKLPVSEFANEPFLDSSKPENRVGASRIWLKSAFSFALG